MILLFVISLGWTLIAGLQVRATVTGSAWAALWGGINALCWFMTTYLIVIEPDRLPLLAAFVVGDALGALLAAKLGREHVHRLGRGSPGHGETDKGESASDGRPVQERGEEIGGGRLWL